MSRYIDADNMKTTKSIQSADFNSIETIQKWIDEQPTADVVEVVRCKDCMHTAVDKYAPAECQNRCKLSHQYHEPNFFCACGEPRIDLLDWIHKEMANEQIH